MSTIDVLFESIKKAQQELINQEQALRQELQQVCNDLEEINRLLGIAQSPTPTSEASTKVKPNQTTMRAWLYERKDQEFTILDMQEHFDTTTGALGQWLSILKRAEKIEKVGNKGRLGLYMFKRPEPSRSPQTSTEETVGTLPVPGTGKKAIGSSSKDVTDLLSKLRNQLRFEKMSNGHIRVFSLKTGDYITISGTPSDRFAVHQVRRDLIKLGVELD